MSKILATIGPVSDGINDIKKVINITSTLRLNGSHNTLKWHEKISSRIKKINKDCKILLDVPGIKPRTNNLENIKIKQGENIIFSYRTKKLNKLVKIINITNPLPKISKDVKVFSISDGQFEFSLVRHGKNFIEGKSKETFLLQPKKGLNIPFSIYDENAQFRIYSNFINKYKKVKYDALGLSFVQSASILKKIRTKFKDIVIVAKIENYLGLENVENICRHTDLIMIDRGDLAAEIGNNKLYSAIVKISKTSKKYGKSIIMATENLDSMMTRKTPTKSEVVALGFSLGLNADKIMLSDETATSRNWYSVLLWLNNFLAVDQLEKINLPNNDDLFWNIIENLPMGIPLVIFSKKGIAIEKLAKIRDGIDLTIFTDNANTSTICSFRSNAKTIFIDKFDDSKKNFYIFAALKKYRKKIFENANAVIVIYISYPRKNSRANTIALVDKKDFV